MFKPLPIVVIDNIDSFTYNLVQLCHQVLLVSPAFSEAVLPEVLVYRNNAITVGELKSLNPALIILSPGPGRPEEAGITLEVIKQFEGHVPLFGVCLGMQALALAHGVEVLVGEAVHGKVFEVTLDESDHSLFKNIPKHFNVVRYHSLHVPENQLNALPNAKVLAKTTEDDIVMAIEVSPKAWGVQFHPESISSDYGALLMQNVIQHALACVGNNCVANVSN